MAFTCRFCGRVVETSPNGVSCEDCYRQAVEALAAWNAMTAEQRGSSLWKGSPEARAHIAALIEQREREVRSGALVGEGAKEVQS